VLLGRGIVSLRFAHSGKIKVQNLSLPSHGTKERVQTLPQSRNTGGTIVRQGPWGTLGLGQTSLATPDSGPGAVPESIRNKEGQDGDNRAHGRRTRGVQETLSHSSQGGLLPNTCRPPTNRSNLVRSTPKVGRKQVSSELSQRSVRLRLRSESDTAGWVCVRKVGKFERGNIQVSGKVVQKEGVLLGNPVLGVVRRGN
jgi:hypothetical protein